MAGICDAAVAAVPLVSVPFSFSSWSALSAPPDLTLSEVVKYGLPRFLGMTKTLRPVFRDVAADAVVSSITPRRQIAPIDVSCFSTRLFTLGVLSQRAELVWGVTSGRPQWYATRRHVHALPILSATSLRSEPGRLPSSAARTSTLRSRHS